TIHRPGRGESMVVIRGADYDGVDVLLLETFAPVHVGLRIRKLFGAESQMLVVDVAKRDNVLARDRVEVRRAAAPGADEGNVQLVAGRVGSEELGFWKDQRAGADDAGGFKELASSLHI